MAIETDEREGEKNAPDGGRRNDVCEREERDQLCCGR